MSRLIATARPALSRDFIARHPERSEGPRKVRTPFRTSRGPSVRAGLAFSARLEMTKQRKRIRRIQCRFHYSVIPSASEGPRLHWWHTQAISRDQHHGRAAIVRRDSFRVSPPLPGLLRLGRRLGIIRRRFVFQPAPLQQRLDVRVASHKIFEQTQRISRTTATEQSLPKAIAILPL